MALQAFDYLGSIDKKNKMFPSKKDALHQTNKKSILCGLKS
jgi:hypothetical protein